MIAPRNILNDRVNEIRLVESDHISVIQTHILSPAMVVLLSQRNWQAGQKVETSVHPHQLVHRNRINMNLEVPLLSVTSNSTEFSINWVYTWYDINVRGRFFIF